jgi:nucleoside recognition membrane protein YjiH
MPHSHGGIVLWLLVVFGLILPFVVLLLITLAFMGIFIQALFQNSSEILPLMLIGFVLGLLWLLWMLGYSALRRLLYRSDTGKK